ncbi:hypothetical protein ND980_15410 [Vibrio diabolicus]|uniref:hypothetical protein n=1 Tax=Vibrio diabolicus TaxID=50719 RepID=UPI00215FB182|nr:hypothetical protein [Vibrio diabolicus]MCS0393613.1 hypothetical protein [Vibrio diabolicus]
MTKNIEQRTLVAAATMEASAKAVNEIANTDRVVQTPVGPRNSFPKIVREFDEESTRLKTEWNDTSSKLQQDWGSESHRLKEDWNQESARLKSEWNNDSVTIRESWQQERNEFSVKALGVKLWEVGQSETNINQQRRWTDNHTYLPKLVPAVMTSDGPDDNWVAFTADKDDILNDVFGRKPAVLVAGLTLTPDVNEVYPKLLAYGKTWELNNSNKQLVVDTFSETSEGQLLIHLTDNTTVVAFKMTGASRTYVHDQLLKSEDRVAQALVDQNGKDWFIQDGFLVTPQFDTFQVKGGVGYVSGNRISLDYNRSIQVTSKPSFVYVDAYKEVLPTGDQITRFDFVVTPEEKDDYASELGVKHFVCKIAEIFADGSVSDLRSDGESAGKEWASNQDHHTLEQSANLKVYPRSKNLSIGDAIPQGFNGLRIEDKVYRISCSGTVDFIDANLTYIVVDGQKRYLQPCIDGQKLYSIDNLVNYPLGDWGEKINYAAELCRADSLTLWIPNSIYKFHSTIELRDIDVQWDGKLELCTNTIGLILNYNVNLKGNPRIIRSKDLELFDQTMVLLTSPGSIVNGSSKTKGCVENKIEQLQILNGWIDYDSHDHGVVIDSSKLTGQGLMLLAGSWVLGLTSIRTHEFVWRNYINDVFVDGFAYPYVLQAVIDDIDPNRWTTWVNGNKLRCLAARRFKKALKVISPLMKPNLEIGGEVAGNTCSELDFQWSNDTSECFLECSGRGNKFEFMGWDGPKDGQATIRFIRDNDFPDGYAEAAGNIVELYGSTAKELNGSDLSPFVYEDNPGLNTFIANGATTKNLIPEEAPPTVGSALTRSYIPKLDNFFAFINTRPKFEAKLYKNGQLQEGVDLTPMFDFNPESAVKLEVVPGDVYEVEVTMRLSKTHFNMIGSTLGYKQITSGRVSIELRGGQGEDVYSSSQSLKTSNVTGFINAPNVKAVRVRYSDFDSSGQLNITSIYGKTYNFNSSSGVMTADGECWMENDVKVNKPGAGVVLRDRATGSLFRIYIENGEVKSEGAGL